MSTFTSLSRVPACTRTRMGRSVETSVMTGWLARWDMAGREFLRCTLFLRSSPGEEPGFTRMDGVRTVVLSLPDVSIAELGGRDGVRDTGREADPSLSGRATRSSSPSYTGMAVPPKSTSPILSSLSLLAEASFLPSGRKEVSMLRSCWSSSTLSFVGPLSRRPLHT